MENYLIFSEYTHGTHESITQEKFSNKDDLWSETVNWPLMTSK